MTDQIQKILKKLDSRIIEQEVLYTSIGVRYGMAGYSLYNSTYGQLMNSSRHIDRGSRYLEKAFEALNGNYVSQRVYNEVAELGLCIEICKECGFLTSDTNEILADFDELLTGIMYDDFDSGNFDPAIGALSFSYYFLKRTSSSGEALSQAASALEALRKLSYSTDKGVHWKSTLMNDDSVYLGISHGIASVIVFCSEALKAGLLTSATDLVKGGAAYIKNCEFSGMPVFFPVVDGKDNDKSFFANNWCYGDPGTLYGLLLASRYLDDNDLYLYSLERFGKVVERENDSTYLIAGYGLLYGYSGLVMLYEKCYALTNERFFKEAADRYLSRIIDAFDQEDEFLGYKGFWNQETAVTNYSFAEGMIGISLLLMSKINPEYEKIYRPLYYL